MRSTVRRAKGLLLASHPGPVVAVTVIVTAASAAAGREPAGLALVALTVGVGQLSVGWSNDARDAGRDMSAGRQDKPTVAGDVSARLLWRLAVIALLAAVVLSYPCAGPVGGTAHVVALASAWWYNLALKTTVLSPLPYAVSFGMIPTFVTTGLTPPAAPATWITVTCALMGVGAHFANALPDIDGDRAVAAGGVAAAIGPRATAAAAVAALMAAVVLLGLHLTVPPVVSAAFVGVVAVTSVAVAVWSAGRTLFRFIMVLAAVAAALVVAAVGSLSEPPPAAAPPAGVASAEQVVDPAG